jgi:hypothetical protein
METRNKLLATGAVMVALTAFTPHHNQAFANTAAFAPDATVLDPITLTVQQQLKFGKMAASGSIGTVNVSSAGVQTATGGAQSLKANAQEGKIKISAPTGTNMVFSVTGFGTGIKMTEVGGDEFTINTFSFADNANVTTPAGAFTLKTTDADTAFRVNADTGVVVSFGATAATPATLNAAAYSGSFTLSLTFP